MLQERINQDIFLINDPEGSSDKFLMRPVKRSDRALILSGFAQTSMQTRRFRFLSPVNSLSDETLNQLLDTNLDSQVAFLMTDISESADPANFVGVVRYSRLLKNPEVAELGILVVDSYQRRGLGRIMMSAIINTAARNGIREIRAYSLQENKMMKNMMQTRGATWSLEFGGVIEYRLSVQSSIVPLHVALKATGVDARVQRQHA